jgi:hypothetical protein
MKEIMATFSSIPTKRLAPGWINLLGIALKRVLVGLNLVFVYVRGGVRGGVPLTLTVA